MPRYSAGLIFVVCGSFLGCSGSGSVDSAPPVATPSLMVSPATVAAGRPIELAFRFAVAPDAPPFKEDYTVFVHVVNQDDKMIGAEDHDPPTPTREWKPGSTVEYTRSTWAPTTRYVGAATFVIGLYSRSTGERLPLAGEPFEPGAVRVGSFEMRERADPYAVVFRDGWNAPESPRGSGIEWRWSMKSGTLSFPNPKRDAELVLQVDQPNAVFEFPQHVEIRMGESVVDAFDLEPDHTELRRISLRQAELGEGETVELAIVSDKTLVPAKVAELQSADTRQLGIRVFRAYVEPKQ